MYRTTVMLPMTLKAYAEQAAVNENVSFGEIVRIALEKYLLNRNPTKIRDSFLSSATVFNDAGPRDVSTHHDRYLAMKTSPKPFRSRKRT